MESISKSTRVSFSAEHMHILVNVIESYSKFFLWCRASEVLEHTSRLIKACVPLAVEAIKQIFTIGNSLDTRKSIDLHLGFGFFKQSHGFWLFKPAGKICVESDFK